MVEELRSKMEKQASAKDKEVENERTRAMKAEEVSLYAMLAHAQFDI